MAQVASRGTLNRTAGGEQNIRVEDYLNDQLQTTADLENLDSLLENVQKQQMLLKDQVRDTTSNFQSSNIMAWAD